MVDYIRKRKGACKATVRIAIAASWKISRNGNDVDNNVKEREVEGEERI